MVAASIKANNPKVLRDAFYKLALQEETFAILIKATAAKLDILEDLQDTKMPAQLKEAIEHLTNIL